MDKLLLTILDVSSQPNYSKYSTIVSLNSIKNQIRLINNWLEFNLSFGNHHHLGLTSFSPNLWSLTKNEPTPLSPTAMSFVMFSSAISYCNTFLHVFFGFKCIDSMPFSTKMRQEHNMAKVKSYRWVGGISSIWLFSSGRDSFCELKSPLHKLSESLLSCTLELPINTMFRPEYSTASAH